jgi:hypothetical protein
MPVEAEASWQHKPACGWCEGRGAILAGRDFPWFGPPVIPCEMCAPVAHDAWLKLEHTIRETWIEAITLGFEPSEVQLGSQEWIIMLAGAQHFLQASVNFPELMKEPSFLFCGKRIVQSSVSGVIVVVQRPAVNGAQFAVSKQNA